MGYTRIRSDRWGKHMCIKMPDRCIRIHYITLYHIKWLRVTKSRGRKYAKQHFQSHTHKQKQAIRVAGVLYITLYSNSQVSLELLYCRRERKREKKKVQDKWGSLATLKRQWMTECAHCKGARQSKWQRGATPERVGCAGYRGKYK